MVSGPAHKKEIEIEKKTNILASGGVFRIQSNIHDGVKHHSITHVNYFRKKASSQMFRWVRNTALCLIRWSLDKHLKIFLKSKK